MGITSRFFPTENTSMGYSVAHYDTVPDPEDSPNKAPGAQDVDEFADFMRATKAPPRDPASPPRRTRWPARTCSNRPAAPSATSRHS